MEEPGMSESMAKSVLHALYKLDGPINRMSEVLVTLPPGAERDQLRKELGDLMLAILTDLMVPIYRLHPQLGRASEPGPWLSECE